MQKQIYLLLGEGEGRESGSTGKMAKVYHHKMSNVWLINFIINKKIVFEICVEIGGNFSEYPLYQSSPKALCCPEGETLCSLMKKKNFIQTLFPRVNG